METPQSTDVGNETVGGSSVESFNSPVATSDSEAAPSSVSQGDVSQTATAGDVTAQSVIEAKEGDEAGTVDPTQELDPLEGVPSLEELEQNKSQQYAQALINLRTAYEARKEEIGSLKPLEALKGLAEYGEPEMIKSRLDAYNSLFTPVVDPSTQQPQYDDSGLPKISATQFIEQVDGDNPGIAEQMLNDLLLYAPDNAGQKVPLWQRLFETWGLDPRRLDDYRKIDALTPQSTGEITPEELANVPAEFQDAYKQLPASVRNDLQQQDEETRKFNLEAHKERFDGRIAKQQEQQAKAAEQQQQIAQARERITQEQETYVSSQLQEGLDTIMDEVARQVTFSADANENSQMLGITRAVIFSLRDPDFSAQAEKMLGAFGTKLDQGFYEALSVADKHMRDQKTYELLGQKGFAQTSQAKAAAAKNQVFAKIAPLAIKVAKALGAQAAQRANQQNQLLGQATSTRPTPGQSGTLSEGNGYGIPEMLPNDPRYGVELARKTGLLSQ